AEYSMQRIKREFELTDFYACIGYNEIEVKDCADQSAKHGAGHDPRRKIERAETVSPRFRDQPGNSVDKHARQCGERHEPLDAVPRRQPAVGEEIGIDLDGIGVELANRQPVVKQLNVFALALQ